MARMVIFLVCELRTPCGGKVESQADKIKHGEGGESTKRKQAEEMLKSLIAKYCKEEWTLNKSESGVTTLFLRDEMRMELWIETAIKEI